MSACTYCHETGPLEEVCYQDHDGTYVCTRAPGHAGPHVACGDEHELETWEPA
ncbi:hypothetical protein NLU66_16650 [Brachybacterium sp. NBEC-018]|uniref:hypothetical protein n=1 Tax=Brachybacterium sp. NBEC-018 TaxID=2996004 RepID=UPI002174E658|nr:hypothetical protein [Brachybacterium sp. NBEC-018]UVY83818.1 hypothetical protein NLU66_16650 [Brachybacterium sp. NBEC-018]